MFYGTNIGVKEEVYKDETDFKKTPVLKGVNNFDFKEIKLFEILPEDAEGVSFLIGQSKKRESGLGIIIKLQKTCN